MSKTKNKLLGFLCAFMLAFSLSSFVAYTLPVENYVFANSLEDNVTGGNINQGNQGQSGGLLDGGSISEEDKALSDWIRNQRGVTGEQLASASEALTPLTTLVGYAVGVIITLIFSFLTLITTLDLLYISVPFMRGFLYSAGTDGTGAPVSGGFGPGMSGGMGGAPKRQWVSDEAVACAALIGGSAGTAGRGMSGMGGMGMNYAQTQGVQDQQTKKSVIGTYFKKRFGVIILIVICVMVLTSSVLMGTGANLAEWSIRLIDTMNGYIPK